MSLWCLCLVVLGAFNINDNGNLVSGNVTKRSTSPNLSAIPSHNLFLNKEIEFPFNAAGSDEATTGVNWSPSSLFPHPKKSETVDISLLADMIWQTVENHVVGCHFALVTEDVHSSLLAETMRSYSRFLRPVVLIDVKRSDVGSSSDLMTALGGESLTVCRVYLIDLITDGYEKMLRFLNISKLWLWPEAWVVIVGPKRIVNIALEDQSLRNTATPVFLSLPDVLSRRFSSPHQASNPQLRTRGRSLAVSVYSRCLFCDDGTPKTKFLFSWPIGSTLPQKITPFVGQLDDFKGHLLRAVSITYFPYMDYVLDSDEPASTVTLRDSLDKRMFEAFSHLLNFTYEVRTPWDKQWGILTKSGNWTGMLGTILKGDADLTTVIAPSPDRLNVINPTRAYPADVLAIVSPKPQLLPQYLVIAQPFNVDVWLYLVVSTIVWGLTLWSLQRMREHFSGKSPLSLSASIFYGWAVILEAPPPRPPTNITGQLLVGWWLLVTLVIATGYKSSLVAHLAVQKKTRPIDSFSDMVAKDDWNYGIDRKMMTGAPLRYFEASTDKVVQQIYKNLERTNIDEGLERILEGKYCYLGLKNSVSNIISSYHTDDFGDTPYYISKRGHSILSDYGWSFRKGAPYHNRFNQLMNRLIEAGIIGYWTEGIVTSQVRENRKRIRKHSGQETVSLNKRSGKSEVVLGLNHMGGVLLTLFLGYFISFSAFMAEKLFHRCHGHSYQR